MVYNRLWLCCMLYIHMFAFDLSIYEGLGLCSSMALSQRGQSWWCGEQTSVMRPALVVAIFCTSTRKSCKMSTGRVSGTCGACETCVGTRMLCYRTEHQGHLKFPQCEQLLIEFMLQWSPSATASPVAQYFCYYGWCVLWLHCRSENAQPNVTIVDPTQPLPRWLGAVLWPWC